MDRRIKRDDAQGAFEIAAVWGKETAENRQARERIMKRIIKQMVSSIRKLYNLPSDKELKKQAAIQRQLYKKFQDSMTEGSKTFTLDINERKFIQACFMDSANEGHFDELFGEIDQKSVEESLTEKGLICYEIK